MLSEFEIYIKLQKQELLGFNELIHFYECIGLCSCLRSPVFILIEFPRVPWTTCFLEDVDVGTRLSVYTGKHNERYRQFYYKE